MTELALEFRVFIVIAFQDAVFDAKSIEGVFAEWVLGDFWGPAGEVFSVKKGDPLRGLNGEGKCGGDKELSNHGGSMPSRRDLKSDHSRSRFPEGRLD